MISKSWSFDQVSGFVSTQNGMSLRYSPLPLSFHFFNFSLPRSAVYPVSKWIHIHLTSSIPRIFDSSKVYKGKKVINCWHLSLTLPACVSFWQEIISLSLSLSLFLLVPSVSCEVATRLSPLIDNRISCNRQMLQALFHSSQVSLRWVRSERERERERKGKRERERTEWLKQGYIWSHRHH